jgi:hypothetical protein
MILCLAGSASAGDLSETEIMQRNYEVNRTRDRIIDITMEMVNQSGKKRVRRLTSTAMLMEDGVSEKRLLRFLYPPDVKGTGFLVIERSEGDDNMWLYLPTLRKSRRKLAGDKKDSFLGTEFSYGDITGPKVPEYTYTLKGEQKIEGVGCYVIESTPASEAILEDYGYFKRIDYIRKDTFTHHKAEFYDLKGDLLKTLTCFDPYEADPVNRKWFIKRREMVNHQNGRKTILLMEKIRINQGIEDQTFSIRNLERGS